MTIEVPLNRTALQIIDQEKTQKEYHTIGQGRPSGKFWPVFEPGRDASVTQKSLLNSAFWGLDNQAITVTLGFGNGFLKLGASFQMSKPFSIFQSLGGFFFFFFFFGEEIHWK